MRRGDEFGTIDEYLGTLISIKWDNGGDDFCSVDGNGMPNCRGYVLKMAEGMYLRLCVKL